ncbi:PI-PLC X domain-containing protein 2-like [Babylonia areolata]|uniref:PI-PLC X domain-containing protein 2-like n=1 Tax=Babylonia areolata TaxID=304850 RepID=UPI003FD0FA8A
MASAEADDTCMGDGAKTSSGKTDQTILENWMGNLPAKQHDVPLHTLYIPGSHNSGTYKLNQDWEVGPDADQTVKSLSAFPMAKTIIHAWSRCQSLPVLQQLKAGVRYLDLRVAHRPQTDQLHLVHALYGPSVATVMEEVRSFLTDHDKEVVILDFNHFYSMELEHHIQLITYLMFVFDGMLCPHSPLSSLTLNSLAEKGTRLIIFYGHSSVLEFPDLWPSLHIKSVWSNTMSVEKCLSHQEVAAKERGGEAFHVCQAVLTPATGDIMQKFHSNIQAECAKKINPLLPQWMRCDKMKGCQGMVLIVDFVEEGDFVHSVVDLNK